MVSQYDHEARNWILNNWPMEVDFEDSEELVNDVCGYLAWIDSLPEITYNEWVEGDALK